MSQPDASFRVGWGQADLTPSQSVLLSGQFYARVSEGVKTPITATAMAFESVSPGGRAVCGVMVSCDLVCIPDDLRDAVRERLRRDAPDLDPMCVIFNATHTHTGPETRATDSGGCIPSSPGIDRSELGVMGVGDYVSLAADRVAGAVMEAWKGREPAGIGYGLGHATVAYNRRVCYYGGDTRMYGVMDDPGFSHLEGPADTGVNVLCVWNRRKQLMGVIVNLASPSQLDEHEFQISADYWHEAREELRRRLGPDLFVLAQVSAAGDVAPPRSNTVPDWKALARMRRLRGIDAHRDVALRIADAVAQVVEVAAGEVDWNPLAGHVVADVPTDLRELNDEDVAEALAEADALEARYGKLKEELEATPAIRSRPRWYLEITQTYRRMGWCRQVADRREKQRRGEGLVSEVHVVRLGDVAFATNRFELYQDFGLQIKARSKAVQTFVVQLAGAGTYLPTRRAAAGKSYGAVPASTPVGPEGGRQLVDWTAGAIDGLWVGEGRVTNQKSLS